VLDGPHSSIDALHSEDTCVYSIQLNSPIWKNECLSPLKSLTGRQYLFPKLTQFSQGYNVLDASVPNIDGFLSEMDVLLQFS
jgi:hypothetical protein